MSVARFDENAAVAALREAAAAVSPAHALFAAWLHRRADRLAADTGDLARRTSRLPEPTRLHVKAEALRDAARDLPAVYDPFIEFLRRRADDMELAEYRPTHRGETR